jgi:hypothetical protein
MNNRIRKHKKDRAVRVNITMHPQLVKVVDLIVTRKCYMGASDYFQDCARRDAEALGLKQFEHAQ